MNGKILIFLLLFSATVNLSCRSKPVPEPVQTALEKAGENRDNILSFYQSVKPEQRDAAIFLIANMPERDLLNLSADFLKENLNYSFLAWEKSAWREEISDDLFNNYILPYANINERRDQWRKDFHTKFYPLVESARTPGDAAKILNQEIWDMINVHYNTKRPKADQSPYESIEASMATCTGLSIILVDACRSVGVPARFVGIPEWVHVKGNHSWVEIWDNGWHYLGAGEPGPLNETWFTERANNALPDDPRHSIFAVSYEITDTKFPIIFRPGVDYVYAINITENYLVDVDESNIILSVRIFNDEHRVAEKVELLQGDAVIDSGISPDDSRDLNDRLDFEVKKGEKYILRFVHQGKEIEKQVTITEDNKQNIDIKL